MTQGSVLEGPSLQLQSCFLFPNLFPENNQATLRKTPQQELEDLFQEKIFLMHCCHAHGPTMGLGIISRRHPSSCVDLHDKRDHTERTYQRHGFLQFHYKAVHPTINAGQHARLSCHFGLQGIQCLHRALWMLEISLKSQLLHKGLIACQQLHGNN